MLCIILNIILVTLYKNIFCIDSISINLKTKAKIISRTKKETNSKQEENFPGNTALIAAMLGTKTSANDRHSFRALSFHPSLSH